ncbi:MAG: phosphate ABC transporter ATP-binding protein [Acidimicrobiia bacterium]
MDKLPGDPGRALFQFADVAVTAGGRDLLLGLTVDVPRGGVTGITGPSGAGKTTMLRLCNRLEIASRGRVLYRGQDVLEIDPLQLRRRVGMVFQRPALFGGTVRDNLAVARPGSADSDYTATLRRVSLGPELLDRAAATLSGGEAQRLCLARTLLTEPEVLLLDEPTSALNQGPKLAFERLVRTLADRDVGVLWVTHDLAQVRRLADHVLVLDGGRLVVAGDPSVIDSPAVQAALGKEQ